MKNIVAFFLLVFSTAFVSCNDDNTGADDRWLLTPEATVLGTTVKMSCPTKFGPGALEGTATGFVYAVLDEGGDLDYATVSGTVVGSTITATLNALLPETRYVGFAYADLSTGRTQSEAFIFETGKESVPDPDQPVFGTPSARDVTQAAATLSCDVTFADQGDHAVYFLYKEASSLVSGYSRKDVPAGSGTKTVTLTGLAAATAYQFELCADWNGSTYTSAMGTFTTGSGGVTPGGTKYSGWAELPVWEKTVTDYRFVEHFCAMGTSSGAPKARNFSACFSADMKCPVWVAAPLHDAYAVKNVERANNYKDDPDISSSIQVGKWSGYSRGHMLGSAERLVSREANNQVMYFSNIGPQLTTYFNSGGGQWNTAEDWVDGQWRGLADTCYQVVGTYWANTSKVVSGTTIPTHYYIVLLKAKKSAGKKWVVNCTRDELQCIGIWIEHRAYSKSEVVKPENFASKGIFMSVSQVEEKTGHTFFANVSNAPKDTYNVSDWNF